MANWLPMRLYSQPSAHQLWLPSRIPIAVRSHSLLKDQVSSRSSRLSRQQRRESRRNQTRVQSSYQVLQIEAICTASVFVALACAWRPYGWCNSQLVQVKLSKFSKLTPFTGALLSHIVSKGRCSSAVQTSDCRGLQLQVQSSAIHSRGVFATCDIEEGTVLGSYPGFLRRGNEMAAKVQRHPAAQQYVFCAVDGWYLDPTDSQGGPQQGKLWGFADTTMAFVNEPPPDRRTNIEIQEGSKPSDVLFVANQTIYAAEELLVDYGAFYDRSSYGDAQRDSEPERAQHRY